MNHLDAPPIVVVGAPLGGTGTLTTILRGLGSGFPAAIAIVQHGRADSRLVDILASATAMPVAEPDDHEPILKAHVYVAPPGYHLLVDGSKLTLSTEGPVHDARPSIDVLFESAAVSHGARVVSVLLAGSSDDGAEGSEAVYRVGGTTIVEASNGARVRHKPAHEAPPDAIAGILRGILAPSGGVVS